MLEFVNLSLYKRELEFVNLKNNNNKSDLNRNFHSSNFRTDNYEPNQTKPKSNIAHDYIISRKNLNYEKKKKLI